MIEMPHLSKMDWDYRDRLVATSRTIGSAAETTFYTYDLRGERVRKVTESSAGTKKQEQIYVGRFEVYREYNGDGTTVSLERETLHVMDDKQRIALVERRTQGTEGEALLIRYQMSNHLGTACLELDQAADIISYEEYTPYGSTAYQAVRAGLDKNPKRYRYTGKERDEENGLSYHSARFYASWLGRWNSCDPEQTIDGVNLYVYAGNNPLTFHDSTGTSRELHGCSNESREHSPKIPPESSPLAGVSQKDLRSFFSSPPKVNQEHASKEETRRIEIGEDIPGKYDVSSKYVSSLSAIERAKRRVGAWLGTKPVSTLGGNDRMDYSKFPSLEPSFEKYASKYGLDPNFVKAIAWQEMTHGWYDEGPIGKSWAATKEFLGLKSDPSIRPMNVQESWSKYMAFDKHDLQDPEKNIEIGTKLLSRIWMHTNKPTVATVATLYNGLTYTRVEDYGRDAAAYFQNKPWIEVRNRFEQEKQFQADFAMLKRALSGDAQAGVYLLQRISGGIGN
jgi:RHS repeat-associated protein